MRPAEAAPQPTADELASVPLFRGLDVEQRALVVQWADHIEVAAGGTVVDEGETGNELFVILSGAADVVVGMDDGERLPVGTLGPGDSFGELGALLRERRAASVVATAPSRLLRISATALTTLLERIAPLGLALSRVLARDLTSALRDRNERHADATPARSVGGTSESSRLRSGLAGYYLANARSLLRRQRLLLDAERPLYSSELTLTEDHVRGWAELFGARADTPPVPFAYHALVWGDLLVELADELGVNLRNLSHEGTRLTFHPDGRRLEPGGTYRVQVRTTQVVPTDHDLVTLHVETHILDQDGSRLVASDDRFVVANVDPSTIEALRRRVDGDGSGATGLDDDPAPANPDDPVARELALTLEDDLGIRYGRLTGNLRPANTSRAGARLLGHDRPFLQHLCVVDLMLCQLTEQGSAPRRLELTFRGPVHPGSTVHLRLDGSRVELTDEDDEPLVVGNHEPAEGYEPVDRERRAAVPDPTEATSADPGITAKPDMTRELPPSTEVDPARMQRLLDGEKRALRAQVRELLASPEFARDPNLGRDAYRDRVLEWCRRLASEGLGSVGFPVEVGGNDDPAAAIAVFETLAEHDLSLVVKYGVQFGLFAGAILHLGTERHHERYLPAAGRLDLPGCFALTELGHGSDARSIRTRAVYDPTAQRYVITTPDDDARKEYIGNAARHGHLAVVFAQLEVNGAEEGVHAFVVPIRDERGVPVPGVRIADCGDKIGLNGVDNGRLWFDDVEVPWDALLDRHGHVSLDGVYSSPIGSPTARFFTMLSTLVQGRISVGLAGVSASRSALTIAVRYGDRRRQFAPRDGEETPLLDYLTHQRRLLVPLATTYALHLALRELVDDYLAVLRSTDTSTTERMRLETLGAGLKAIATSHASATIQECREACGGAGYLWENRFGALRADSDIFTTFEGDNTVLLQLVAKTLLTDYKQQFEDMDLAATVRFVVGHALAAVVPTPASRRTDEQHLRSRTFQLEAFRAREQLQLAQLARRLKGTLDRGSDPHAAFIRHQSRVVATARSHVERVMLERFAEAIDACDDPTLVRMLSRLCDLYALAHLERDRGWFLEQGLFAGPKARAIVGQVDHLCRELRPHAAALVDAFGIPDALLGAPIATPASDHVD